MLIGADYYWKVVLVERLTKSLVALESIFGWAEQGPIFLHPQIAVLVVSRPNIVLS